MRLFVYEVSCHPLDVTAFDEAEHTYVPGVFTVSALGPNGQEIGWAQDRAVAVGAVVDRLVVETSTGWSVSAP